jgi:hypothetical protein
MSQSAFVLQLRHAADTRPVGSALPRPFPPTTPFAGTSTTTGHCRLNLPRLMSAALPARAPRRKIA